VKRLGTVKAGIKLRANYIAV